MLAGIAEAETRALAAERERFRAQRELDGLRSDLEQKQVA
jgi:hypothetical protein